MKKMCFIREILFFLVILLSAISASLGYALKPEPPEIVGHVIWIDGALKAQLPHAEIRILKRQSPVYKYDTLTTDSLSQGAVAFIDNDEVLKLAKNSTVHVEQYQHAKKAEPSDSGFIASFMKLIREGLRAITGTFTENTPGGYIPKQ